MKNINGITLLIQAAETADDPLDQLACRRAAAWLRWCDGYGAALTETEAQRIAAGGALGESARGLIRRLCEEYPAPIEDMRLEYLDNDDGAPWSLGGITAELRPLPVSDPRHPKPRDNGLLSIVIDPFKPSNWRDESDLPEPTP